MENIGKFLGLIVVVGVGVVLMSLVTMWLWNWLMPTIFGLTKIGFFQALGLNILSTIFFNNIRLTSNKT